MYDWDKTMVGGRDYANYNGVDLSNNLIFARNKSEGSKRIKVSKGDRQF